MQTSESVNNPVARRSVVWACAQELLVALLKLSATASAIPTRVDMQSVSRWMPQRQHREINKKWLGEPICTQ
jgi:hypothetical protein